MNSISNLNFHNTAVSELPVDPIKQNYVRTVSNSCLSLVDPTPVKNPQLVHYSQDALNLIDLDIDEFNRHQLAFYFSGNEILPGSVPYASCYCGHQFKVFVTLGDGRAISLGEIVNHNGERWELQLKGAGKTPFSRKGDGRAALRSSIREYLCSEFMYHLGIPTTRAGTIVTSDTLIERDINYDGNVIQEKATILSRLAPSFLRFGSFQIADPMGPSEGNYDIIKQLLKYVIQYHYSNIYDKTKSLEQMTIEFADELCLRTANTVALWQAIGFTHGVLNTDNMSILGLTIDYGPFGFMDNYDPDFVPNTSDKEGRYRFSNQSAICKWNLRQLFQSIGLALPSIRSKLSEIVEQFCDRFNNMYLTKMRLKLGLVTVLPEDGILIDSLLNTMHITNGDYTNIFRSLSQFRMDNKDSNIENQQVVDRIMEQTRSSKEEIHSNRLLWISWLMSYKERLEKEETTHNYRIKLMNDNNPKYILRNHLIQIAIEKAEKGDYTEINRLYELIKNPFVENNKFDSKSYTSLPLKMKSTVSLSCSS